MKTEKLCFAIDKDLMLWQEANCINCKKAVWYNQRLGKMPQYRCAIQKQIEVQAAGEAEINERTYKATRCKKCAFFKPKEERPDAPAEVLDFSKGESLMKSDMPLVATTKDAPLIDAKGLLKQPTSKLSDKETREALEKCNYYTDLLAGVDQLPRDISTHPDPALFKLAMETGVDYDALKDAERRMFDTLCEKGQLPPVFTETNFKKQVKNDVHTMLETFTWEENMMIAFVPLVISHIAWLYAEKVMKYCADHRIPETVKLSRAVKHVRQEYVGSLKKDLDAKHVSRIEEQTEQFCKLYANDFTIMWYCVNSEYCKRYPDDELLSMRTDAYVSILLCRFLVAHNKRMDKIIEAKMGFAQSIKNPYMDKLESCMDAYCGEYTIQNTDNINACLRILEKNIKSINFEIDDSEPK